MSEVSSTPEPMSASVFKTWKVETSKALAPLMAAYFGARVEVTRKTESVGLFLIPVKAQFLAQGLKAADFIVWATGKNGTRMSKAWVNDALRVAGVSSGLPEDLRDAPIEHLSIVAKVGDPKTQARLLRDSAKRTSMDEPTRTAKLREETAAVMVAMGGTDPGESATRAKATRDENKRNELRDALRPKIVSILAKIAAGDLSPEEILLAGLDLGESFAKAAEAAGAKVSAIGLDILAEGETVPEDEIVPEDTEVPEPVSA